MNLSLRGEAKASLIFMEEILWRSSLRKALLHKIDEINLCFPPRAEVQHEDSEDSLFAAYPQSGLTNRISVAVLAPPIRLAHHGGWAVIRKKPLPSPPKKEEETAAIGTDTFPYSLFMQIRQPWCLPPVIASNVAKGAERCQYSDVVPNARPAHGLVKT
jgi:hypothetical protein